MLIRVILGSLVIGVYLNESLKQNLSEIEVLGFVRADVSVVLDDFIQIFRKIHYIFTLKRKFVKGGHGQ